MVDLKTFLAWLCLSNRCHKVNIKLVLGRYFGGKKSLNFMIQYQCTVWNNYVMYLLCLPADLATVAFCGQAQSNLPIIQVILQAIYARAGQVSTRAEKKTSDQFAWMFIWFSYCFLILDKYSNTQKLMITKYFE